MRAGPADGGLSGTDLSPHSWRLTAAYCWRGLKVRRAGAEGGPQTGFLLPGAPFLGTRPPLHSTVSALSSDVVASGLCVRKRGGGLDVWVGALSPLHLSLPAGKRACACPDSLPQVARDGSEVRKPFLPAVTSPALELGSLGPSAHPAHSGPHPPSCKLSDLRSSRTAAARC